ncbi:MAG: hypothetical protein HQL50_10685 [Magnetococcales bacterium]|nr:hypothetical protein [Magnetococcales bacterium]
MNIIEKSDDDILAIAVPMWSDLIKYSNKGEYGPFTKHFAYSLMLGLNEVEMGKQFTHSTLTKSLAEEFDVLGTIRRGEHVTVLFRQRSTERDGEWLGRLVIGYEKEEVKIFGASIF